jgi:hypothetical protein
MLVIKGADLQPVAKVLVATGEAEKFGGRAELIRHSRSNESDDVAREKD